MAGALIVISGRPGATGDPLGMAAAQVSAGKTGMSLAQARQQVITADAATEEFSVTGAPRISVVPLQGPPVITFQVPDPTSVQGIAYGMLTSFGFDAGQWGCLDDLWQTESGWRTEVANAASGAYGIPQALPGDKMASAGADWRTNPATQIKWGLGYIRAVYGTPCAAWAHEEADHSY